MEECGHDKVEICGTSSCAKCYYEQLMNSKDRARKEPPGVDMLELLLTTHARERYMKEKYGR